VNEAFIDTNVLLRHLLQDHEDHSPRSTRLLQAVARGEIRAHISETVVFETLYTSTSFYKAPRPEIADALSELLHLSGLVLDHKQEILEAIVLWVRETPLSFADCYHLVLTKALGLTEIYTFDKKMGRYPGVTRIEP